MKRGLENEKSETIWMPDIIQTILRVSLKNRVEQEVVYFWLLGLRRINIGFSTGVTRFLESDLLFVSPHIIRLIKVDHIMKLRAINEVNMPLMCSTGLVKYLTGLNNLQSLDIRSDHSGIEWVHITRMTNLTSLVSNDKIDGNIIKNLTKLKSLSIHCSVYDDCLSCLGNLTYLNINPVRGTVSSPITNNGLRCLTNLTKLVNNQNGLRPTRINLGESLPNLTCLEDSGLYSMNIIGMTNLTRLVLSGKSGIDNDGISTLINLEELVSSYSRPLHKISNEGIERLTKLRVLDMMVENDITGECLEKLTNLESLRLTSNPNVYDNHLEGLANITNLTLTYCCGVRGIHLHKLTNLRNLTLVHSSITTDYIAKITTLDKLTLYNDKLIEPQRLTMLRILREDAPFHGKNERIVMVRACNL